MPQSEWAGAIERPSPPFPGTPYVLQEFHKGRLYEVDYFDPMTGEMDDVRDAPGSRPIIS